MKGNRIIFGIEFSALRNYLDHAFEESGREIEDVFARNEAGEYPGIDDLDNALFYPMRRQELASRTIYYEINALVESELQSAAREAWVESDKFPGPKTLDWRNITPESIRSLRQVADVSVGKMIQLINEKYGIKVEELQGFEVLREVREAVNAFKHTRSYLDIRRMDFANLKFPQYYRAEIEKAYEIMDHAYAFITSLWDAVAQKDPT